MIMCVTGNIHTAREYARNLFDGIIDVYIGRYHGYAQTCMRTDHDVDKYGQTGDNMVERYQAWNANIGKVVDETDITVTKCTIGDLKAID